MFVFLLSTPMPDAGGRSSESPAVSMSDMGMMTRLFFDQAYCVSPERCFSRSAAETPLCDSTSVSGSTSSLVRPPFSRSMAPSLSW